MMPAFKRPAPDKPAGIPVYQQSAAAYQQLMQMQHQPYIPVSCEYSHNQNHVASTNTTVYPQYTSTATQNANNLHHHHHLNLTSQSSINACNSLNNNNNNQISSNNNNNLIRKYENNINNNTLFFDNDASNNFNPSTFIADADSDAQINTPTAQQNSINQSSPSKAVTPSNIIENNMLTKNAVVATAPAAAAPDGDSENANLTVQNAKINANGTDGLSVSAVAGDDSDDQNFSKSIDDVPNGNDLSSLQNDNHHHQGVDDATQTSSVQSTIDKNNLNAISFNSATSSSPAASLSASTYTTSSISNNNNNNNSILSRKNSLSMSNQLLISNSKAPTSVTNTPSSKVDSLPDLITASALNNSQAALLSAVLYNQNPYQQYAIAPNIYSDPAQMAKDMAQKNYANALKYAVAAQNTQAAAAAAAKSSLTALPYTGVALPGSNTAMYAQQQAGTSANPRLPNPMTQQARSPYMSALSRPLQNPFQQYIRPQMAPVNMTAATHPYYAAAAAHQQFLSQQQNLFYSGLTNPMAGQQLTATSGASTAPTQFTSNTYSSAYPFGLSQSQAMNAQGLPASMMQVPQMTAPSQQSQTGSTSAVVLNPYKKMKTS